MELYKEPLGNYFAAFSTSCCCGQMELGNFLQTHYEQKPGGMMRLVSNDPTFFRGILNRLRQDFPKITSYHFTHKTAVAERYANELRACGAVNVVEIPWSSRYKTKASLKTVFFEVRDEGDNEKAPAPVAQAGPQA